MKVGFLTVCFLLLTASNHFAQESQVQLKQGKIVVKTLEDEKVLDYSIDEKYRKYDTTKWKVKQETTSVDDALQVFKNKDKSLYSNKVWIIRKSDGENQVVIEFVNPDADSGIVFSPDEDYAYYISSSDDGDTYIHGIHIATQEDFVISNAFYFELVNCPESQSYIVVQKQQEDLQYFIHRLDGEKIDVLSIDGSIDDLENFVCY